VPLINQSRPTPNYTNAFSHEHESNSSEDPSTPRKVVSRFEGSTAVAIMASDAEKAVLG
jgi:hypothetical protein